MRHFLHRTLAAVTALGLTVCLFPAVWADETPDQSPNTWAGEIPDQPPAACADETPDQLPEEGTQTEPVPALITLEQYLQARQGLEELGYPPEEVETLCAYFPPEMVVELAGRPRCPRLAEYAVLPYFHEEDLERYIAYGEARPELDAQDVVTYVNIGLDRESYTEITTVEDPGRVDVLVNKYRTLGSDYTPELVRMGSAYTTRSADYMQPESYEWFVKMADAAREEGLRLRSVSAYRSYTTQKTLFNGYAARSGVASAETYSARPGHSEHQTGLALDINVASTSAHFERTAEYRWLTEHCWEYGFILRYSQEAVEITGYIYEPWHYRYVGVELAGQIRDSGLTYDEFVARQDVREPCSRLISVTLDGKETGVKPVALYDQLYFPVYALLRTLRWSFWWEEERLVVFTPAWETVLDPQVLGGMICGEELYLPAQAMAQAFGLGLWQTEGTVLLSSTPAETDWPFVDVLPYHDRYAAVRFVWQRGLFAGVSEDRFDPDGAMTRGMAVTVLAKLDLLEEPQEEPEEEPQEEPGDSTEMEPGVESGDKLEENFEEENPEGEIPVEENPEEEPYEEKNPEEKNPEEEPHEEENPTEEASPFTDVNAGDWYAPGVAWAQRTGLVSGCGDGTFRPNDAMTWEQAAIVLGRFARYAGLVSPEEPEEEALPWAVERGLLDPGEGEPDPQRILTRAELALALERLYDGGPTQEEE